MKIDHISKLHNLSVFIGALFSLGIFFFLNATLGGMVPQIIFLASLTMIFLQQTIIYRPIARAVTNRNEELKEAKRDAEKIAKFPINNPHPLIQIAFDGDIIFANPAAYSHYPTLRTQGFQHHILADLDDFMAHAKRTPDEKHITTREILFNDIYYHQTISSVVTNGRQALVIYCHDITAIKAAQNDARLLGTAVDGAKDGVIITKADLENPEIIYVNEAVTKISGYEPHELIGQTPRILQGPATCRKTLDELKETLLKGRAYKGEIQNYTKDGHAYWLDISIVPVKDEDGSITHFAAIERDITDRKAFEKQLEVTKNAAEVANRAKDDFLANMSHELRTPMNGIIGLSELLMEMEMTEEQNELAEAVNTSSRNLLILLNDILDLSKIEAGELTLENIPYDTRYAVRQTVDLLKPIASRKSVVLESNINPIVPERLMGDPARLQQIMNNLISNAIKFTEVGYVRIDVTSARDSAGDPELHIRVEDTGIGIPEDKREAVFQKFTQADVSTARKYGGTGLGLSITKELVEMMGGTISFDSAEGKGTTFYVELPIEVAKEAEKGANMKKPTTSINTDARVMVVDDHPVNLLLMRKVLKKIGFTQADEACSGKEAIELAEKNEYELIFMDCQMPEIDGFEASTIIREREDEIGDIKIIAVTADAMKGAREKCLDAGMNDYISKPVDVEKLKAVLGEWLPGDESTDEEAEDTKADTETHIDAIVADIEADAAEDRSDIMDWERMALFTDGDPEEEKALIEMFTTYATESLEVLENALEDGQEEDWKKAAHKLKGSAANLGANLLSDACLQAEERYADNAEEKGKILTAILLHYGQVSTLLNERQLETQHA